MSEKKKRIREALRAENMRIIERSGLKFEPRPTCILVREAGKPGVDFYPSTGRWYRLGDPKAMIYSGGADAFLDWYEGQSL